MVIRDFHVVGVAVFPAETDAPLVVDADAVLAFPVAFERFEPVARRHAQVFKRRRCIEQDELAVHHSLKALRQPTGNKATVNFLRFRIGEALDHAKLITRDVIRIKRY